MFPTQRKYISKNRYDGDLKIKTNHELAISNTSYYPMKPTGGLPNLVGVSL
jgi:hypothetical protein